MAGSAWIITRPTKSGGKRYRVRFRVGGREAAHQYGGSFSTRAEALARKRFIDGELAARRVPGFDLVVTEALQAPTLAEACETWRATRIDVTESTRTVHRVALGRALPPLGAKRVDEIGGEDIAALVQSLVARGKKRGTIRKTLTYLTSVFEHEGVEPNPAQDRRVRLPHEETEELVPPTADAIEAVYDHLAPAYRLPLLWLDWSGARVSSVEKVLVGDCDQPHRRVRLRKAITKTRAALWVELPDVLAEAVEATLPPRLVVAGSGGRDADAPLFPDATADALRTALARACRAVGVPVFSPHDLRHRRISVLHQQGRSWAEIARFVGQRKLSLTADTYTHVLVDGREVDLGRLLAR
jgi:integrase